MIGLFRINRIATSYNPGNLCLVSFLYLFWANAYLKPYKPQQPRKDISQRVVESQKERTSLQTGWLLGKKEKRGKQRGNKQTVELTRLQIGE